MIPGSLVAAHVKTIKIEMIWRTKFNNAPMQFEKKARN
jgi:hypothetical protein